MKSSFLFFLAILLLPAAVNKKVNSPTGLMVEFIRETENIKILDLKPEFSWIVPEKAVSQTAYQILVASSRKNLEQNKADIWDSRKIISTSSTEVEFGGSDLAKESIFFWKVRIWNNKGIPSEYSEIQPFTTGVPVNYLTTANKFQTSLIKPVKVEKIADNHYFTDFGRDAFGTLELEINPAENDTIIVHLGEKIIGTNRIDRNPGGSVRYQKVLIPVRPGVNIYLLNLPEDSRNTGSAAIHLPDSFGVITPFRYCELENFKSDPEHSRIMQKAYHYFFVDETSAFSSSDTILNKIWDLCKYSIKATSFAGIYIDGDRERIPYEADAYINQMGHYYTDREFTMARVTNEYFIKHPTWPTEWILHTVPMFYYDFMYSGNIESVKRFYKDLKFKTLTSISREDGLISSKKCTDEIMISLGFSNAKERIKDIVDWPPSQKDTGWKLAAPEGERDGYDMMEINTVVNAFYYRSLVCMSVLAGRIGEKEDSAYYISEASKLKLTFNDKLLNKTNGIYIDGEHSQHSSLHANMLALAFDLVPEENLKTVINFIKLRGMACSVYGSQYLLEGLYRAGEADYAYSLLTSTGDRSWWNMIKSGSSITMEAWDIRYKPNSDWNHAWGAAPANIIPRCMWGIIPAEPGYSKAIIKPQLSSLKYSKISVPTIRGNIQCEFKMSTDKKEYLITIPANIECEFVLPEVRNCMVLLNNKKTRQEITHLKLRPGLNTITIKL